MALPLLPYREPKIYESITDLRPLLKERRIKSVLLVTDSTLRSAGITNPLEMLLKESGIHCAVYDKTYANPTVHNVEDARKLYVNEKCQCLIAFGGGSSMDCAKGVGARIAYPKKSLDQLKGLLKVLRKIPMLIAIPTTAGTGSEVTLAAVITDSDKKHKYTMNDFTLIPSYAVLDPTVTYTLPPSLTATTGMDALTHAVEAYIGRSTSRETRTLALEATSLIFGNIETAYRDGTNRAARDNMLHAAYKAGAEKFIAAVRKLNQNMNIPDKLRGIRKEDIPKMARHAAKEANPLYPVPMLMNAKELEKFYYEVADWS